MSLTRAEVDGVLASIEAGVVTVVPDENPKEHGCGTLGYTASDGWRFEVFNDCNSWDYLESVTASDGRMASPELMDELLYYRPQDDALWGFVREDPGPPNPEFEALVEAYSKYHRGEGPKPVY